MKEKKLKDLLSILDLSESIKDMYKILSDLEINNKQDTEEYKDIVDLIKDCKNINNKKLRSFDILSDEIQDFYKLIVDANRYDFDKSDDYLYTKDSNKINRLLQHIKEILVENHYSSNETKEYYENKKINIFGQNYTMEEGISLLKEAGHDDIADYINTLFEQAFNEDYQEEFNNENLVYYQICLENSLIFNYLEETIKNEKNNSIKNELIKFKYKMIFTVKSLEDAFVNNLDNKFYIKYYQNNLKEMHINYPYMFENWNNYYQNKINTLISEIMVRNKEKYISTQDVTHDIILSLRVKSYLLMISEFKSLFSVYDDVKTAKNLTKSKIDFNLLNSLTNIDASETLLRKFKK